MKNNYLFQSERLGFRKWRKADLEEFAKLNADELVMEHFPKTLSEEEVVILIEQLQAHYTENGFTYYATEVLETKEFIGMIKSSGKRLILLRLVLSTSKSVVLH